MNTASTTSMSTSTATSTMSMSTMMFSNDNTALSIFSSAFSPTTVAQYVGAWFFTFILAIIWRALVFSQTELDQYWKRKYGKNQIILKEMPVENTKPKWASRGPWRLSTHLPRAALAAVTQGVAYLLMIIVMILNVGLFFAVIAGYFVGELIFGRVGSYSSPDPNSCS